MEMTAFDNDRVLTNFLSDYLDGKLDKIEEHTFVDYLDQNPREKEFTRKAQKGKQALNYLAKHLNSQELKSEVI